MVEKRSVRNAQHRILTLEFIGDFGATAFALVLAYTLRFKTFLVNYGNADPHQQIEPYFPLLAVAIVFFMSTFAYSGMYSNRRILHLHRNVSSIVKGSTFWLFLFLSLSLAIKFEPQVSRVFVAFSYVSVIATLVVWRLILHRILIKSAWLPDLQQHILILGTNNTAVEIASAVNKDDNLPYLVSGYVGQKSEAFTGTTNLQQLGEESSLTTIFENTPIDILVVTGEDVSNERMLNIASICEKHHVDFKITPSSFQVFLSGLQLQNVSGVPLLGIEELPVNRFINRIIKRGVDIVGGAVGCLFSAPIILTFGLIIKKENSGPIFFLQDRIGERNRNFQIIKLRSMKLGAETDDHLNQSTQREDPRVLKIGKFMRRWNLDELPQFWNVLKGEMSLVGPRPERTYHVEKLVDEIPHYGVRHIVKPGLTGWAQINGLRGDTDLMERIQYDIFYIENWSYWMDFYILVMTFFKKKNAY
jgi:exopolysaccharide biosynthesis polyprenyl glycosylphosphotransferase